MPRLRNYRNVRTTNPLKGIYPLLKEWTAVVEDFCRSDNHQDNPWWYNERASLSTLAGAAWRLPKWNALEEFSTTKRGKVPEKSIEDGAVVRGRCDLYVSHPTTSFAIEAKQAWQPIGRKAKKDHVLPALRRAMKDAGHLTANQADHRLGVVFAAPYVPLSEVSDPGFRGSRVVDPSRVRASFDAWVDKTDFSKFDAYGVVFVARCEQFVSQTAIPRVFPGVLVAIQRCKTGAKRRRA